MTGTEYLAAIGVEELMNSFIVPALLDCVNNNRGIKEQMRNATKMEKKKFDEDPHNPENILVCRLIVQSY